MGTFPPQTAQIRIKMLSYFVLLLAALSLCDARAKREALASSGLDLEPIFNYLDADKDGNVDNIELTVFTGSADGDGDDKISRAEFEETWKEKEGQEKIATWKCLRTRRDY